MKCGHQGGGSSDGEGDVRSLDVETGKRRFDHGLGRQDLKIGRRNFGVDRSSPLVMLI